ncbi:hypothetical protein RvY_16700 [Ramazzottius varieornatus]|uniref:Uncharacterized protein n=1 Tax=Ramazzottius varieornatus TaxID=947166 RepID=A0A1D1W6S8_RAMVA|nr:hypothetical protein RvY_16700 [Ramazzottius varieornatus]
MWSKWLSDNRHFVTTFSLDVTAYSDAFRPSSRKTNMIETLLDFGGGRPGIEIRVAKSSTEITSRSAKLPMGALSLHHFCRNGEANCRQQQAQHINQELRLFCGTVTSAVE